MTEQELENANRYVCPYCKGALTGREQELFCPSCDRVYPVVGGVPDFLAPVMGQVTARFVQQVNQADRGILKRVSGMYEGRFWYPFVIRVYLGKNTTTLPDLIQKVKAELNVDRGRVLDAACGTATFGRRVVTADREVFGIDVSMAMLQTGLGYIRQEQIANIHLARTQVEYLPFPERFFDFAICSGALHLFSNTVAALREISRTLKPGARLVGLTFFRGSGGLLRYGWFRERLRKRGVVHVFEQAELENDFSLAGFEQLQTRIMGSGLFFSVEKCR